MDYSLNDYLNYEHSLQSDEIKKKLELSQVDEIFESLKKDNLNEMKSLDIGCATCRYPQYFNSKGFLATGFDINIEIVQLYSEKLKKNKRIKIENKNFLEIEPHWNYYDVITCMMGTFNHFNKDEKMRFIKWVHESLKTKGALIFSLWNQNCYYPKLLSFYKRSQIEFIKKNLISQDEVINLLKLQGFKIKKIRPICLMPNICYEAWEGEMKISQFKMIDKYLRDYVDPNNNAQMIVIEANKA